MEERIVFCKKCKEYKTQKLIYREEKDKGTYKIICSVYECPCGFINRLIFRKCLD